MEGEASRPATVDEYIAQFPPDLQETLARIRAVIKQAAPEASEKISYGVPGYFQNGALLWFAAYKRHIGLYPRTAAMAASVPALAAYKGTKGSVHLPLSQPVPYDMIAQIVKVRLAENVKA